MIFRVPPLSSSSPPPPSSLCVHVAVEQDAARSHYERDILRVHDASHISVWAPPKLNEISYSTPEITECNTDANDPTRVLHKLNIYYLLCMCAYAMVVPPPSPNRESARHACACAQQFSSALFAGIGVRGAGVLRRRTRTAPCACNRITAVFQRHRKVRGQVWQLVARACAACACTRAHSFITNQRGCAASQWL